MVHQDTHLISSEWCPEWLDSKRFLGHFCSSPLKTSRSIDASGIAGSEQSERLLVLSWRALPGAGPEDTAVCYNIDISNGCRPRPRRDQCMTCNAGNRHRWQWLHHSRWVWWMPETRKVHGDSAWPKRARLLCLARLSTTLYTIHIASWFITWLKTDSRCFFPIHIPTGRRFRGCWKPHWGILPGH